MTSFNTKLVLAAIGIAMLASPALAQRPSRQTPNQQSQDYSASQSLPEHYPNGAPKTGSAAAQESGADFNLGR
ncbi:MAG TPA: hypothetical protein VEK75_01410 [Xanthobacteraceae bacterium]|nr:hypothetical protein [Xanthobacteraceae bacterium]